MGFYGRTTEQKKLGEMYQSGHFELAVIYGRRRIGKTTLIREFISDKKAIFFTANESTAQANLLSLSRCIGGTNRSPVFTDYESAFSSVFELAVKERLIFVIDEFPYLEESYRGISSLLQIQIDHKKDKSKLMIILCGSSMSFMENQVLGHKSPLFGRRTAQFKLLPFTFFESLPFFSNYNPIDKAILYGITGGVPEYLSKINTRKNVRENIIDLFLSPSGHFFEEPQNLIKQELREPSIYNVIIESIAFGATRLNEIASRAGLESNKCAKYLNSLITLALVKKEYPYGEKISKRSIYRLEDFMFRFWYRFVFPNTSSIAAGLGEKVFDNDVENHINDYMGFIFEDICKQWFFEQAKKTAQEEFALPFFIGDIGRWWGANSRTHSQEEIDLMTVRGNEAIFAECKWRNTDTDISVFNELKRKSAMFPYQKNYFYIFTKKKFSKELIKLSKEDNNIKILALTEMICG